MQKKITALLMSIAISYAAMPSAAVNADADMPPASEISVSASGDVNDDGVFDADDVIAFRNWLLAVPDTELKNPEAADLCGDGRLDAFDLCLMRRALASQWQNEEKNSPPLKVISPSLPSIGTNRILVAAVDFPDYAFSEADIAEILEQSFFGSADSESKQYPYESICAYYERASYGKMKLTGDVLTYTAEHTIDWYADDDARSLVTEIMTAFDEQIDYRIYDADKNNILDAIALVLPDEVIKIDNNCDGKPDWWAFTAFTAGRQKYDGISVGSYSAVVYDKEDCAGFVGKMTHELGHAMGLPDYYKYTQDDSYSDEGMNGPAGDELMDEGRGDLSACSKLLLGWLENDDIQVYTGGEQTFTITSMQYSPSCILIPRYDGNDYLSEYFLIEYITKEANNSSAGGNGIRILHVEAEVSDGKYGTELRYGNNSPYYDKSNQKQRVLRLVNRNGQFYPGKRGLNYTDMIDGSIEDFHWYDEEGCLTEDTGLKINIDFLMPGPDFDWNMDGSSSFVDIENDPSYIKGSTYQITISPTK